MDLLCKHRPTMMSILVTVPDNYQILDIEQPRLDQTKEIVHILNWHYKISGSHDWNAKIFSIIGFLFKEIFVSKV